jgi:hypothetical protein
MHPHSAASSGGELELLGVTRSPSGLGIACGHDDLSHLWATSLQKALVDIVLSGIHALSRFGKFNKTKKA